MASFYKIANAIHSMTIQFYPFYSLIVMIVESVQTGIFVSSSAFSSASPPPTAAGPPLSFFWLSPSKLSSLPASASGHLIRRWRNAWNLLGKGSDQILTLHVVASCGSSSRCSGLLKSGRGGCFFCRFVWLKMLDKPQVEWYCLLLIHSYHTEFIGNFIVFERSL
jgi:hypothetical protein